MNWIPAEFVDAMAPTTGWAGTEDELLGGAAEVRRHWRRRGASIPTSSDIDQLRRVADVVMTRGDRDAGRHGR